MTMKPIENLRKVMRWSTIVGFLCLVVSCQEWDKWDSPSGNQVYPTLEKVATYSFEDGIDSAFQSPSYLADSNLYVTSDADLSSKVLVMNGGYAYLDNPMNSVTVQDGVSLTFWVKQTEEDLNGALFSFQNETGTQKLTFTANGWLDYQGSDGSYELYNPSDSVTGLLSVGEWHYVAVMVRNDGYSVYVDGESKLSVDVSDFDFSNIVQFMATSPYLYIGAGTSSTTKKWMLDDLVLYRNQITSTQTAVPSKGGSSSSSSDYITVGSEDFTTSWWTEFSDMVTMSGNQTMHFGFYNYTDQANNWDNWVLVVTNGKGRSDSGYAEYFVLRADAYGWGDSNYSGSNITNDFNFSDGSFLTDMNGAYVDLTLKRNGTRIDVTAVVTATDGTVYNYTFYYEGVSTTSIGAFLTCEEAYLKIDPSTVYVGESYSANSYLVGPSDLSASWWTYFSDYSTISGDTDYPFVYTFYNYTSEANNWNNWVLAVTNGYERDNSAYAEYFVLRADAYGWGDSNYSASNLSANYDWDSFKADMNGAFCKIILTRSGTTVNVTVKVTTADGTQLDDYTFSYTGISTTNIGTFLTVEGAYLDMRTVGYYPFLSTSN